MNISATIIAYNEEKDIAACIASARQVCDEVIVVVDKKTTDATAKIAKAAGARVFHLEYLGDGPQKAWAVPKAKYDWILSIDADERLAEDMVAFIRKLNLDDNSTDAYAFRRKNYVGNHWIKAAGFYPNYVVRLYHRARAGYSSQKYHAAVKAKKVIKSHAHILHRTYESYADWLRKIDFHSSLDAWAMYHKGKKPGRLAPLLHALVAFIRKFFLKGGFLQGMDGITVTLTTMVHVYFKYMKCLEMYATEKSRLPEASYPGNSTKPDKKPVKKQTLPARAKRMNPDGSP